MAKVMFPKSADFRFLLKVFKSVSSLSILVDICSIPFGKMTTRLSSVPKADECSEKPIVKCGYLPMVLQATHKTLFSGDVHYKFKGR